MIGLGQSAVSWIGIVTRKDCGLYLVRRRDMQSLMAVLSSAKSNPSPVIWWCNRTFEFVSVGYAPEVSAMQIACFDYNNKCRLCIRYQIDLDSDIWSYEVVHGSLYRRIEIE